MTAGILPAVSVFGQDSLSIRRQNRNIAVGSAAVYSIGLVGLNSLWYSDYERSSFHSFNDNSEWLQMDKVGHAYSTYTLTNLSYQLYRKGNRAHQKRALAYSSASAFLFLTTVEVFDGYSKEWGFSWGDFTANSAGIGLFVAQELLFQQQILRLKYSYTNTKYRNLRPNTFGENTLQSAFKDYNGQTYWASFNLNALSNKVKPKWLNFAVGYSVDQMVFSSAEDVLFDGKRYSPRREYLFSLDLDWEKIETKKKWLSYVFKVANCIKIPAPAILINGKGNLEYRALYF
ncbi:MAG: DUF2279 domain-containing protein [Flavobacteriales bacterium]|nr:DUF2279 domain-containing protein [Flavobacteriales bacterium]